MVAFKICGFLNTKETMHCKYCDNLKMETAVEIIGEKEKNQFWLQVIVVPQEVCKKCKNSFSIESSVKTISAMNSAPAGDKSAQHLWHGELLAGAVQFPAVAVADLVEQWCCCSAACGGRDSFPQEMESHSQYPLHPSLSYWILP